jgi:hypothetical protein
MPTAAPATTARRQDEQKGRRNDIGSPLTKVVLQKSAPTPTTAGVRPSERFRRCQGTGARICHRLGPQADLPWASDHEVGGPTPNERESRTHVKYGRRGNAAGDESGGAAGVDLAEGAEGEALTATAAAGVDA